MSAVDFRHARLLRDFSLFGGNIEDLARAWASIDGKRDEFDEGRDKSVMDDKTGHYAGYVVETEEILERAIAYARGRKFPK